MIQTSNSTSPNDGALELLVSALRGDRTSDFKASPAPVTPSADLRVLALLAESHELESRSTGESGAHLSEQSLERLRSIAGSRPAPYWHALLRCGEAMNLLERPTDHHQWKVTNLDAELLGATRRECFPAFLAVWLRDGSWGSEVLANTPSPTVALDLVRSMGVFCPGRWYRLSSLSHLVSAVLQWNNLTSRFEGETLAQRLVWRVFMVLGMVEISQEGELFRLHRDVTLPPLPNQLADACAEARSATRCRAMQFSAMLAERLDGSDVLASVQRQLACVEMRRTRTCRNDAFKLLFEESEVIETDPQTPFKDCLLLARIGRVVGGTPCASATGRYVFHLDASKIGAHLSQGLNPRELMSWVEARCTDHDAINKLKNHLARLTTAAPERP